MNAYKDPTEQPVAVACRMSDGLVDWLAETNGTIAVTTYQAGKLALASWDGARPTVLMRNFTKPMGLAADGELLAVVTRDSVLVLANAPVQARDYPPGQTPLGHDRLYLPRVMYNTCDLDVHDVAFAGSELWVVATRFSCLATLSHRYSLEPRWRPPFVTDLTPEDRCHLNGLALHDGRPKLVTALAGSNEAEGWRSRRESGGILMDVETGELVRGGLCMPHSPRITSDGIWLLESGKGQLLHIGADGKDLAVVTELPGYTRGLALVGGYALVGLSLARERETFGGLPIGRRSAPPICGVALVDLRRGVIAGVLQFTSGCQEIYDVQFIPGTRKPMVLNLDDELSSRAIAAPEFAYWMMKR